MKISCIAVFTTSEASANRLLSDIYNQTHRDIEVIAFNPNGYKLLEDPRLKDFNNLKLAQIKDMYNYAIYKSTGRVIALFNENLSYSPSRLERQYTYFVKNSCVMLGCGFERFSNNSYYPVYPDSIILDYITHSNHILEGTEMFDKKIFIKLGGYISNDFAWTYNKTLVRYKYALHAMHETLAREINNDTSVGTSNDNESEIDIGGSGIDETGEAREGLLPPERD